MLKISVALCTYNGKEFIEEQLRSILNQNVKVDEIVICDDGSSDETVFLCEQIMQQVGVNYTLKKNENNLGFKKNFFQAISLCTGDIVFLCDQDDVWLPNKTEKIIKVFESDRQTLLVFSNAYITDEQLNKQQELFDNLCFNRSFLSSSEVAFEKLLNDNFVVGATAAIRKNILEYTKKFENDWAHDSWFAVIAAIHNGIRVVNEPLILYRQHTGNTIGLQTADNIDKLKKIVQVKTKKDNYGKLRFQLLDELRFYLGKTECGDKYITIVDKKMKFWSKRIHFAGNSKIRNIFVVIKDALKKEQKKHRNIKHPIIVDLINAWKLSE